MMATQSSQSLVSEGKQMDIFQLESRVSHAKQTTGNLQSQLIGLNEEIQQTQCKLQSEQEIADKIDSTYKEVEGELRKEKKMISDIQTKSKASEGTKRGYHSTVVIKKKNNEVEIDCQSKLLRKEKTTYIQAQHDQLCAQAQLENINRKLEITLRVVDQLEDRVKVLRKVLGQKQCQDQQMKAKMVLLKEDLQSLCAEGEQLGLETSKVREDKATIIEAMQEVRASVACTAQAHEKLLSEISDRTKELNDLISYRQKLEQRSYSLKEELLKSRRHLEGAEVGRQTECGEAKASGSGGC